jgi:hypothetical protein
MRGLALAVRRPRALVVVQCSPARHHDPWLIAFVAGSDDVIVLPNMDRQAHTKAPTSVISVRTLYSPDPHHVLGRFACDHPSDGLGEQDIH